jgi:hypothetical protein
MRRGLRLFQGSTGQFRSCWGPSRRCGLAGSVKYSAIFTPGKVFIGHDILTCQGSWLWWLISPSFLEVSKRRFTVVPGKLLSTAGSVPEVLWKWAWGLSLIMKTATLLVDTGVCPLTKCDRTTRESVREDTDTWLSGDAL